jgi:hypothetical protein
MTKSLTLALGGEENSKKKAFIEAIKTVKKTKDVIGRFQ